MPLDHDLVQGIKANFAEKSTDELRYIVRWHPPGWSKEAIEAARELLKDRSETPPGRTGEDKRARLLRRLRRRRFDRIRFRALDAVVFRVSKSVPFPPSVQARMQGQSFRLYPVEGDALLVKWPHTGEVTLPEGHSLEPGGWDHEHCDGCNRHILVGWTFWQTAGGSCFWLCPYCYRRLRQLQ